MALTSKAPDITERPLIDLSGRIGSYYDLNGNAFDIAIGGLPFIMAVTDNTPYKRQTADFRAQRVDQMRDPGEHTLAGSGYWTRSQSSFHYGDGINYTEPMEGNDSEVRFRYHSSYGVNPWVPGELTLLKKTTLVQAFSGKCKVDTGADANGVDFIIATDMSTYTTQTTAMYKITTSGTSTAFVNYSSLNNETILATTSDGANLYVATTAKIYDINLTSGAVHHAYTYDTGLVASGVVLKYAKSRVMAGLTFTNGTVAIYELTFSNKASGAAVVIKSSMASSAGTLVNGSTNLPTGFKWNCITEARNALYIGGYIGEHSTIFKLQVDNTGALGTVVTTALLPRGEVIYSLYSYLGTYVMIGTSKGARVATSDTNGDLTYGPLTYENSNGVYDFEARSSYVWCGATNGINTSSGTYRINLGQPITLSGYAQPITTGVYAKASDVFADGITGTVRAVRIFNTDRVVFAVDGSGVWVEHATDLVPNGQIITGYIRFDTLENKSWKRVRLRTPGDVVHGEIEIFRHTDDLDTLVTTIDPSETTSIDYDLAAVFPTVEPEAAFKLEMYRNTTDATTGAIISGISVKALPTPTRARILQIPLFCYDRETDKTGNIIGYEGYAKDRLGALESVEAKGETIIIQDFNAGGDPFEVIVEQITFTRSTPANRNYTGFGGVIQLIARTVV